LEAQEQQCLRFWERQLKPIGVTWADFMADEAVSAFKKPLFRRPKRQRLLQDLHSGDHLNRKPRPIRVLPQSARYRRRGRLGSR